MNPVTAALRTRLKLLTPSPFNSPMEQQFHEQIVPQLNTLILAVERPDAAQVRQAAHLWKPLRQICHSCGHFIR